MAKKQRAKGKATVSASRVTAAEIQAPIIHSAIDPASHIPLYHQLYLILRDKIVKGVWQPGDPFPKDSDLEAKYGVSRITVRRAVDTLVNENMVIRQRGRGSFVAVGGVKNVHNHLFSFDEEMHRRNLTPSTKIIALQYAPVSDLTASQLNIRVGEELAGLKRLRYGNGEPQCYEEVWLVHAYCSGILETHDFSRESLTHVLEEEYHLRLSKAEQTISAIIPTRQISKMLGLAGKQPVLFLERVSYSQRGVAIDYRRIYYRGDRFALHQVVNRDAAAILVQPEKQDHLSPLSINPN
jgi:GntR family transcriptional regulator